MSVRSTLFAIAPTIIKDIIARQALMLHEFTKKIPQIGF
jgi:hypothetical protein